MGEVLQASEIAAAPQSAPVSAPDDAQARARRVLEEAAARGVAPDPRAFAVLYAYLAGVDAALVAAVDEAIPVGGAPAPEAVERLHDDHLDVDAVGERFLELGAMVERELGDLDASLARRAESDGVFIGRLSEARAGMHVFSRPGAVRHMLRELIETTETYAEQTEVFSGELSRARSQIEELTVELQTVRESAHLDHLTGLANRRRLDKTLEREIAGRGGFCVVIADLDRFKRVNDDFGHAVGDSVLRQFAAVMRQSVRESDLAARFGGEEFALVLPNANLLAARHVAERIRQEFASRAFVVAGSRQSLGALSASFGVAEHRAGEGAAALLARADAALYRAKRSGRNRVAAED